MLLASSELKPGMLLNIVQCTGHFPETKHCLVPSVNGVSATSILMCV